MLCQDERKHSGVLTAVVMPDGHDADALRERILERFDMSLGAGLGRLKGRVFRIGHLGDFNDLMLAGALCGVEMGLALSGVPIARDGVAAALACLETRGSERRVAPGRRRLNRARRRVGAARSAGALVVDRGGRSPSRA